MDVCVCVRVCVCVVYAGVRDSQGGSAVGRGQTVSGRAARRVLRTARRQRRRQDDHVPDADRRHPAHRRRRHSPLTQVRAASSTHTQLSSR